MKIIKTKFFDLQVLELSKKYKLIENDLNNFEDNLDIEPFSDLGNNILKYRIKNSSIPTWKRGWFRIIVKKFQDKFLPFMIYSKTIKENVTEKEIINSLEKVFEEL